MKFLLNQLDKYNLPYKMTFELDLKDKLKEHNYVKDSSPINVELTLININHKEISYDFLLHIRANLTLECAITLDDVLYKLDFKSNITFSKEEDNIEAYLIENDSINIDEAIFTEILINLPTKVVKDGAYFISDEYEKKESVNNTTSNFKDQLLKLKEEV